MELNKSLITSEETVQGRKITGEFTRDLLSEHTPVAVYVHEFQHMAEASAPPSLGHVENARPPPPGHTVDSRPLPPGRTEDSRPPPPGHNIEDFRPTAPGHSPGIGHSIQN
ncbi:hypothetical protein IFM89_031876 [Coptis chinensis]|uniref:Uncharacterized protein n=1 Tax=Coptis chinensis TaxID=261450 RepID=A0A835IUE4_9MAGN|nr:hypothetical protein IFM89_031876 [Coptis chinensis]